MNLRKIDLIISYKPKKNSNGDASRYFSENFLLSKILLRLKPNLAISRGFQQQWSAFIGFLSGVIIWSQKDFKPGFLPANISQNRKSDCEAEWTRIVDRVYCSVR